MPKLHSLGYISVADSVGRPITSISLTPLAHKSTEFGEITKLTVIVCYKVTDFGTNIKRFRQRCVFSTH